MENKIFEKLQKDEIESAQRYMVALGVIEEGQNIRKTIPKKNTDLEILLAKLDLIEPNKEIDEIINDFHDYLYKLGIQAGISGGKKQLIEAVKDGYVDFDDLMKINPDDLVTYNMEPTFIRDLKEAVMNEK